MLNTEDIIQKIKDDLYLTGKQSIMDDLPENQNALFIGKFRVPTKAHIGIIEKALKEFNHVVVCVVKAKKDVKASLPLDTQEEILEKIFGRKISVITHSTGNMTSIINKSPKRVRYVLAGTDRVESYEGQLKRHKNVSVVETKRDMESKENISATKTIEAIKNGDETVFKKMMHRKTWNMFKELQEIFK
jgi:nicotinamide mononucleotide adenylyltransferase